jgi:hypothetical protein
LNSYQAKVRHSRLSIEQLESRDLLAVVWANKGTDILSDPAYDRDGFTTFYQEDSIVARQVAQRAVDDWNAVIPSFNYPAQENLNNTFTLNITASDLGNNNRGQVNQANSLFTADKVPYEATVELDDNAVGTGWFFDTTPLDDAEFTGIVSAFQGNFTDASTGSC